MNRKFQQIIKKEKTIIGLKLLMTILVLYGLIQFLQNKDMYTLAESKKTSYLYERIIVISVICVLEVFFIFIKNKLSEKTNLILSIILWIVNVPILFIIIEYSQGFEVFRLNAYELLYNIFMIFAFQTVFYAVTNSIRFSIALNSIIICIFGLSNFYIIKFRGAALLASDLYNVRTAINVADNYEYSLNYNCFVLISATVLICTIAFKLKRVTPFKKYFRLIPIIGGLVVAGIFYGRFIASDRYDISLKIKMYKPQKTYELQGSVLTFVHSFRYNRIERPDGYSIETVRAIADKYSGIPTTTEKKPNIIVIMNEAFNDLSEMGEIDISQDCMPFFHSLKEDTIKGKLFVSIFAGGTANTEFEVLTSNTLAFTPAKSSPYQIYINKEMPSLASTLKAQGYQGILAMHPFRGNGYKRNKVYPLLGFEKFITQDDFENPKRVRALISDEADFDRIIEEYEESREKSATPFFMFNVTMQNHGGYDKDWDNLSKEIKVHNIRGRKKASRYVNLIKESDNALKKLIKYFKNEEEPTIIVFFGDHQPRLGDRFYSSLLKKSYMAEKYKEFEKYFTPFMIWANYDIKEQENLWISANYLSSTVLETAGLAQSGYQQYVSEMQKEVPVMTQSGYIGSNGKLYSSEDTTSPYYEKLNEYHILQYNNLFDVKNRVSTFFEINK